jgi:uncharacterized membrane protein YidH (DUF202 family)
MYLMTYRWLQYGITALAFGMARLALAQGLIDVPPFEGTAKEPLPQAIITIVNVLLVLAALVAAIFLVIGGIRYITSQGDEEAADKAKNTILYSVIGLIVIGLAAALVNFIVGAIQGA